MLSRREMMNDEIVNEEGKNLLLRNCKGSYLHGMKIYGCTTQETTTGAQLYDVTNLVFNTANGEIDNNGWITLDYDNSDGISDVNLRLACGASEKVVPGRNYLIVAEVKELSGAILYVTSFDSVDYIGQIDAKEDVTESGSYFILGTAKEDTSEANSLLRSYFPVPAGSVFHCRIRFSVIEDTSVTAGNFVYEPYTGGIPSPNTDYPQELVSAGQYMTTRLQLYDGEDIKTNNDGKSGVANRGIQTYISGGNVLDMSIYEGVEGNGIKDVSIYISNGIITLTGSGDGTSEGYYVSNINIRPLFKMPGKYCLSFKSDAKIGTINVSDTVQMYVRIVHRDGTDIYITHSSEKKYIEFMVLEDDLEIYLRFDLNKNDTVHQIYNIMINSGTIPQPYEPYRQPQLLTFTIPNGLPGIPVSSGGNYTDENGQQWIADYRDWERGVDVQCIGKRVLDGTETWNKRGVTDSDSYQVNIANANYGDPGISIPALCTHFIRGNTAKIRSFYIMGHGFLSIAYAEYGTSDVSMLKEFLSGEYEKGEPVTILYQFADPIVTPIPADELSAYRALHTNTPTTTITNDEDCWMEVGYRRIRG